MFSIATPISHLFKQEDSAINISNISDCLECRDHSPNTHWFLEKQWLFHTDLQPCHRWSEKEWNYLVKIKDQKNHLKLISFHLASCYDAPEISNGVFVPGGNFYSEIQMSINARENISKVREIFGSKIEIAIENNNYYPTEAYEKVTEANFILRIVLENGLFFLFDIAHAFVTAVNSKVNVKEYIKELPMDKLRQIHICKYGIREDGSAYDAHYLPDEQDWSSLGTLISQSPSLRYLTIEYYKNELELIESIKILKKLILDYENNT